MIKILEENKIVQKNSILLKIFRFIHQGVNDCKIWMNTADILVSAALGLLAWSLVCLAFIGLLDVLNIILPLHMSFSLYPLAMLVGAASMIPGGIGTTEAAIMFLLSSVGVSLEQAALAALGIRIATLWFAMACGLVSVLILEIRNTKATISE